MCYSRDYATFEAQQKKAQEEEQRRTGVIDKLRNRANKEVDKAKETTATEDFATAK